jgi:hypothetical protein
MGHCYAPGIDTEDCLMQSCGESLSRCVAPLMGSMCSRVLACQDQCPDCEQDCREAASFDPRAEQAFHAIMACGECAGTSGQGRWECLRTRCYGVWIECMFPSPTCDELCGVAREHCDEWTELRENCDEICDDGQVSPGMVGCLLAQANQGFCSPQDIRTCQQPRDNGGFPGQGECHPYCDFGGSDCGWSRPAQDECHQLCDSQGDNPAVQCCVSQEVDACVAPPTFAHCDAVVEDMCGGF